MPTLFIPTTVARFVAYFLRKQQTCFFVQFTLCFGWSTKEALFPFFIKNMINSLYSQQTKSIILQTLLWQGGCLFLLWTVMELAMRWQGILAAQSFPQYRADIRTYLFNYVQGQTYDYFNTHSTGDIASKISSMPRACENLLEIFLLHVTSIGGAITISIILLGVTDGYFAVISVIWLVLHVGISFCWAKMCHQASEQQAMAVAALNGKIVDVFMNIMNVLLFAQGQTELNRFASSQQEEVSRAQYARWMVEKLKICQSLLAVFYLLTLLSYLIGGWFYGMVSPGDFALVPMLAFSLLGMVWWLSGQIPIIFREVGNIKAGLQLLKIPYQIRDKAEARLLKVGSGEIIFHDVSFNYPCGQSVFQHLFLSIPAKQKIGLVGFSGAGKSTLVRLLLRLHDVDAGAIMIDRQNIADVTQHSLRQQIAVIPQDLILFHRSLYENIQYGDMNATAKDVYAASQIAGCHEFIQHLPQGYQTLAGEKGTKLSGGQRQRIGIARAILKNSPVLILDEATSALDFVTESSIQNHLDNFLKNKTVIIIAHHFNTLDHVDRIVVFEQGRIVGDGNKATLLQTNLPFQQLYAKQYTTGVLPDGRE